MVVGGEVQNKAESEQNKQNANNHPPPKRGTYDKYDNNETWSTKTEDGIKHELGAAKHKSTHSARIDRTNTIKKKIKHKRG